MTKAKTTKRALLLSVLSMMLCMAMLIGSTFAWFTDTVTSGKNKIVAGNLDVELFHTNGTVTAEEKVTESTTLFVNKGDETFRWEPGAMLYENFTVKNVGSLALKYQMTLIADCNTADGVSLADVLRVAVLDGAFNGDRTAAQAQDFSMTVAEFVKKGAIAASGEIAAESEDTPKAVIIYWQPSDKDNDYNFNNDRKDLDPLTIDLGMTLVATQAMSESDSFGNDYDENARYPDTAEYTLAEFNELSAIPENITAVYVNLSGVSLEDGLTIGNAAIADHYNYGGWNSTAVPADYPYDTGKTDVRKSDGAVRHLYSTGKKGVDVVLTGTVLSAKDTGTFNAGGITLKVPDASSVTFEKVTFGAGQMSLKCWQESFQSAVRNHCVKNIAFNKCVFEGNWLQNGTVGTDEMSFNDCEFKYYENTAGYNNSNPIWIQNLGDCNVTIQGCVFNACRPIKLWENTVSGTVTIRNNTFNMQTASADTVDTYKDDAILFSTITGPLGDVVVSGNTVNGGTGFLTFFNPHKINMAEGATFTVSGNTLNNGVRNSVEWKTTTDYIPDFVTVN